MCKDGVELGRTEVGGWEETEAGEEAEGRAEVDCWAEFEGWAKVEDRAEVEERLMAADDNGLLGFVEDDDNLDVDDFLLCVFDEEPVFADDEGPEAILER